MDSQPDTGDVRDVILGLERLREAIGRYHGECDRMFDDLAAECDRLLAGAKQQLHASVASAREEGKDVLPQVQIEDRRLKNAWIALYRHHGGATADEVGREMGRHRTTVSTLLNTLVVMHWATKKRDGHEIVYQAVLKEDRGSGT